MSPQLNGATAVIDSYLGHLVGFWSPSSYAAAGGPGSPFHPLDQAGTGHDNLCYTGNPGQPYNLGIGPVRAYHGRTAGNCLYADAGGKRWRWRVPWLPLRTG